MNIQTENTIINKAMPYLFWASVVISAVLLLIELTPTKVSPTHTDKIIHALIFLSLSTLGYLAFPKHRTFVIVGLVFYGALSEILQYLLTVTRSASLLDWLADLVGILLCLSVFQLLKQHAKK